MSFWMHYGDPLSFAHQTYILEEHNIYICTKTTEQDQGAPISSRRIVKRLNTYNCIYYIILYLTS